MDFEAIRYEVEQLHSVSKRLALLAEQYPPVSEALLTISGSVCDTATILGVLIATRMSETV